MQKGVELRINREIRVSQIRVIGEDGESDVFDIEAALTKAAEEGLDLVEINPKADPPICKIMDYGKYKFLKEKKSRESKKKQKVIKVKEVKIRPKIEEHDLEFKLKNAVSFLENGDKVKLTLMYRGREIVHQDIGRKLMARVIERISENGQPEREPKMEGRNFVVILVPVKKQKKKDKEKTDAQGKDK